MSYSSLILDTCAYIFLVSSPEKLSIPARDAIFDAKHLCVCDCSAWEIAIKLRKRKLEGIAISDLMQDVRDGNISMIRCGLSVCSQLVKLPHREDHADPFDLLIISAALEKGLPIVTSDAKFPGYAGVDIIW